MTNQAVETAFGAGITQANLDIIKENIQITYISAALRYLNKMDRDLTGTVTEHREHQGEGHSFWLTAVVADYDEPAAIDALDALYTNHAVPGLGGRFCEGLAALTHGMTADQLTMLGTLNEASGQTCHNADVAGMAHSSAASYNQCLVSCPCGMMVRFLPPPPPLRCHLVPG